MPSYESFEKLPEEKRSRIFRASMEVFAENGYDRASTNKIVKRAGISKGILFHYFGNKKNLYMYVLNKSLDRVTEELSANKKAMPEDVFERIMYSGMIKMKFALEEPLLYKFIYFTFVNTPESLKKEVREVYGRLYSIAVPMLTEGLDLSKIRGGIEPKKAIEVILFFMEGLQARYMDAFRDMRPEQSLKLLDQLWGDCEVYIDILKKGIYGE